MKKYILFPFLCLAVLFSCEKKEPQEKEIILDYELRQAVSQKRGISFNNLYATDFEALGKGVSWGYNWAAAGYNGVIAPVAKAKNVAYFPMCWNGVPAAQIRNFKAQNPECEYILAFNEPNLTDQANMTPAQAAAKWGELKSLAQELNMKIVAPAMNYGTLANYSDPIKWLDEFFAQPNVSLNDVSALAIHCYMNVPSAVKSYVERFRKYNKPLWMTEFCAWEGTVSVEKQREYMSDIINYFEADTIIERYAWFKFDGNANSNPHYALRQERTDKGELTDLGKIYINISSLDQNLHYAENEPVPAEHYSGSNVHDAVGTNKFNASVQLKISSDVTGILEVANFGLPKYLEYKIFTAAAGNYKIDIRYAASGDSKFQISIDNENVTEINLPKTGDYTTWQTLTLSDIHLKAGQQTIRLTPTKGMISLNWWRFRK